MRFTRLDEDKRQNKLAHQNKGISSKLIIVWTPPHIGMSVVLFCMISKAQFEKVYRPACNMWTHYKPSYHDGLFEQQFKKLMSSKLTTIAMQCNNLKAYFYFLN